MDSGKINEWMSRILWTTMTGIGAYAANELKSLNTNIQQLNVKMAVIVERVQIQESEITHIKNYLTGNASGPLNVQKPKPLFTEEDKK